MTMAYSAVKWTISGDAFNGREIWTTGFWTGNDASDLAGTSVPQATVDAVASAWQTFFTSAGVGVSNTYKTNFIKAAYWHTQLDGSDVTYGTPTYKTYTPAIVGASAITPLPPQITLAASFGSGYRNGTASHGRMYLPGIPKAIDSTTGALSASNVTAIINPFLTFVNAVNTATVPGSAGKLILVGRANPFAPAPHQPKNAYVTTVRIGDVYDTQRRRRNAIHETYQSLGVA